MSTKLLERTEPEKAIELASSEGLPRLADEARQYLGYDHASQTTNTHDRVRREREALISALLETDTRPFDQESVTKYKAKAIMKEAGFWRRVASRVNGAMMILAGLGIISFIGSLIFTICFGIGSTCGVGGAAACATFCSWIVLGSVVSTVLGMAIGLPIESCVKFPAWQGVSFHEYKLPIPEYVLQTAIDIKKRCPAARLTIQQLVLEKHQLDPFLVLEAPMLNSNDQQCIFLEVWEEPSFVAKRLEVTDVLK